MKLFDKTVFKYSGLGVSPLLTEFLVPLLTESGEIIQKENFDD